MAISKHQPMREAEQAIIDFLNEYTESTNEVIQQYAQELQTEITAREALERRVEALETQMEEFLG